MLEPLRRKRDEMADQLIARGGNKSLIEAVIKAEHAGDWFLNSDNNLPLEFCEVCELVALNERKEYNSCFGR